jgi:hypothetical protein
LIFAITRFMGWRECFQDLGLWPLAPADGVLAADHLTGATRGDGLTVPLVLVANPALSAPHPDKAVARAGYDHPLAVEDGFAALSRQDLPATTGTG